MSGSRQGSSQYGQALRRRIEAAQGKIPCDLVIRHARYLDVFSCEFRQGDVAMIDGYVVGIEQGLRGKRDFEGKGKTVVPGFIDAHVHVESSMMMPGPFQETVLPRGTTTAICDPHEIANVQGLSGIQYFLEAASGMQMDLWVMLSSCVPATHPGMETNGAGVLSAADLLSLAGHPRALGLAEMMNMPGVLAAQPDVLEKLEAFADVPLDGHCPLLRGKELSAYAAAGISSCHESTRLDEAREKLMKGIACWIREGSVAKDLKELAPLLTLATSTSIGFCTDDRNPYDIATEGHIDYLVRAAIASGVAPEVAYRAASWSVARHYGLNNGARRIGAVAPGYRADLVILEDAAACSVHSVLKDGKFTTELEKTRTAGLRPENTIRAAIPEASELSGPAGRVKVIGVDEGKILTRSEVMDSSDPAVARLSVLERYGQGSKPANAYVTGFGEKFTGAIASSVGHDSHNLIVAGKDPADMRVALAALAECGGGFCVVNKGQVAARLPLPLAGLMSELDSPRLKKQIEELKAASRAAGCVLREPFLQLAFLSLPVIPSLKLTDKGLVDVNQFKIVDVRA